MKCLPASGCAGTVVVYFALLPLVPRAAVVTTFSSVRERRPTVACPARTGPVGAVGAATATVECLRLALL